MSRYICIHGHFYQPPRENPWLEEVEVQDTAYPFHDWNERITAECYAPNSVSRILNSEKFIVDIVNNYSRISFNFGPTLLAWLEKHHPEVYEAILDADRESQKRFSGHGSALAQAYSHLIMPLANSRDKRTQVIWGISDFRQRFGRNPEGMWLPETAADRETLDILAEQGIKFTILSPLQANRVRKKGDKLWQEVKGGKIDPKLPYICQLPSGRVINIFFYDQLISHDIAFGDLLKNGELFANRLLGAFFQDRKEAQLVHIATDGESYGHHHRFADMALAYCLHKIEKEKSAELTVYGDYLEKFHPEHEVEIVENSSWSCVHGVERWRSNCGCNTGANPGWTQQWRAPLRQAMDWLRDELITFYEDKTSGLLKDSWKAREDYIAVVLDRSQQNIESFLSDYSSRKLSEEEKVQTLKLLELQHNAMLMYTSCGWFFDEISRIEPIQIMQYAARAMQMAKEVGKVDLEPDYVNILKGALSNVPDMKNGARIYEQFVKPAVAGLLQVGVHYALSSLFEDYSETEKTAEYTITRKAYDLEESGRERLALGQIHLRSDLVLEEGDISFAVLHLGDHNLIAGVSQSSGQDSFSILQKEIKEAFDKKDITEVIRLMDRHFGSYRYSLKDLFRDEKRKVLSEILDSTLIEVETSFRQIVEDHYPVMLVLKETKVPLPKAFSMALEFILNTDFRRLLKKEEIDLDGLQNTVQEFHEWSLHPDKNLSYLVTQKLEAVMEAFSSNPQELALGEKINRMLDIMKNFPLDLNLWKSQNIHYFLCKRLWNEMLEKSKKGDQAAKKWLELMDNLGQRLYVRCG